MQRWQLLLHRNAALLAVHCGGWILLPCRIDIREWHSLPRQLLLRGWVQRQAALHHHEHCHRHMLGQLLLLSLLWDVLGHNFRWVGLLQQRRVVLLGHCSRGRL